MKRLVSILYFLTIGLLLTGMIFRILQWPFGNIIFTLGLLGVAVYFIARTIKDIAFKRVDRFNIVLQILLVLMSIILFSKYLYHSFGDYLGLLVIPLFIILSFFYIVKGKTLFNRQTIASITYLILSIPLFGLKFYNSPQQYIPQDWYDRYNVESGVPVTLPYGFRYTETEQLSIKAFELCESKEYYEAVLVYEEACKLEPENPQLLFDLANTYAKANDLEKAIVSLDKAIKIDSTIAVFYSNRGLLYYKLMERDKAICDYQKAIQLDSSQMVFYANIALAYYHENLYNKSCESIKKAEKLGFDVLKSKELKRIKTSYCK
jgi:tetratricopeptide (TPR) repeat protein